MPEPLRVAPTRVWHLELGSLRPSAGAGDLDVRRAEVPFGPVNRFFYEEVGRDFSWTDKAGWTRERWQSWAEEVETWIAYDLGLPAGYGELRPYAGGVELQSFGLLAPFRGRGLGGALLTAVTARAADLAAGGRVTVQTCELDGPHARANYEARGYVLVRETVEDRARTT